MNTSLSELIHPLARLLARFHLVFFVLVIAGGLAAAIFYLNLVINRSQQNDPVASEIKFDTETIKRIEELKTRNDSTEGLSLGDGRINPFVE